MDGLRCWGRDGRECFLPNGRFRVVKEHGSHYEADILWKQLPNAPGSPVVSNCSHCYGAIPTQCDGRVFRAEGVLRLLCVGSEGRERFLLNGRFVDSMGTGRITVLVTEPQPVYGESPVARAARAIHPFVPGTDHYNAAELAPPVPASVPFNGLTPAEAERIALLIEECGEVIQIAGKILRHGFDSHNPDAIPRDGQPVLSNRHLLEKELGDVLHAVTLLIDQHDVRESVITQRRMTRNQAVRRYLHHQDAP